MHINQEYAVYVQAESEGQDFVIAKKKKNQTYFEYLGIVLYIFSLENSAMIMSDADTIYANFFGFVQSWN